MEPGAKIIKKKRRFAGCTGRRLAQNAPEKYRSIVEALRQRQPAKKISQSHGVTPKLVRAIAARESLDTVRGRAKADHENLVQMAADEVEFRLPKMRTAEIIRLLGWSVNLLRRL